jgi:hypothetical protein
MRIGVRLGPVWVSTSTSSRRRGSRTRQPSWHATGHAWTPDRREVDFRCQHNHRSQAAAVECAHTIRKQIMNGYSLHLVTRVRSTPDSRVAAREEEAKRKAEAAQRAEAAKQREARQQERRQAKAARRAEAAQQRAQTANQRAERREAGVQKRAEEWAQVRERNDERWERWERVQQSRAQHLQQLGWPVTGLIIAGGALVLGLILAGVVGNNSHSALAAPAGALVFFGFIGILVCATVALWRRFRGGNRGQPIPDPQIPAVPYSPPPFTDPVGYAPGPYPGRAAAEHWPDTAPPARPGGAPPWDT